MAAITESPTTAGEQRPILIRLPFAGEPIVPSAAATRTPHPEAAFLPGAWHQLIVAAELDRESRELPSSS